jgi:apolipoprotein N-acyltransferase
MPNADDLLAALVQVIMAALGALARVLNKREESLQLTRTLGDLFVAGFTGLMLYWVASATELKGGWLYAASGIAGWAGPSVLDWLTAMVVKKTGIPLGGAEAPRADKPPGESDPGPGGG